MEKKKSGIGKVILIIFLLLLAAAGGAAFYLYRMANNYQDYVDKYVDYQSELAQIEGSKFEDCITYDKDNYIFSYEVPRAYIYKMINIDSMSEYLGLPEELQITEIGVEPDLNNKKVYIYLGIKYKNIAHFGMKIDTDLTLSSDMKRLEIRYSDYYLINDMVMKYADEYINMEKGELMFKHTFPTFVVYYQMPDFKPQFVSDLSFDGKTIRAKYDIKSAIAKYKEEEFDKNSLEEKLDAVWLEVRQSGIKHN